MLVVELDRLDYEMLLSVCLLWVLTQWASFDVDACKQLRKRELDLLVSRTLLEGSTLILLHSNSPESCRIGFVSSLVDALIL